MPILAWGKIKTLGGKSWCSAYFQGSIFAILTHSHIFPESGPLCQVWQLGVAMSFGSVLYARTVWDGGKLSEFLDRTPPVSKAGAGSRGQNLADPKP